MTRRALWGALMLAAGLLIAQAPAHRALGKQPKAKKVRASAQSLGLPQVDKKTSACNDFYAYTCGPWMSANPIPGDQSIWGTFNVLAEHNRKVLHDILEGMVASKKKHRSSDEQKIGDYYAACMDLKAIDKKGLDPLRGELDRISGLKKKTELAQLIAHLHQLGADPLFSFGPVQDFKDASQVIAQLDQGGLGLPDRDYYLKKDKKSVQLRKSYRAHLVKIFQLIGHSPKEAQASAAAVLRVETKLARASMDRVLRRDPRRLDHKLKRRQLVGLAPSFSWDSYIKAIGAPEFQSLNVAVPKFFRAMGKLINATPLNDLQAYLTWQLVNAQTDLLPQAFVQANFEFYGRQLKGQRKLRARWKRCVDLVDSDLGFALGKAYVQRTFSPTSKKRMKHMVAALEKALAQDIKTLPWMTEKTKKLALAKLATVANNIGYPDKWRDYSKVSISARDAMKNHLHAAAFEAQRLLAKIGKPVDRSEWQMTPGTVNAYYDPQLNSINFPAGILQPPFFDAKRDDAVNYGAIGAVIGHELTHGFDDEGRRFDAQGNLKDWWTHADAKAFEKRARCLIKQYSGYTAVDKLKLNGKLTLGENIADNGGVRIAFLALQNELAKSPAPMLAGFTAQQRFFLGWGQVWCQNRTKEAARLRVKVDPHSPGKNRVNGVLANLPQAWKAFSCPAEAPLANRPPCSIW